MQAIVHAPSLALARVGLVTIPCVPPLPPEYSSLALQDSVLLAQAAADSSSSRATYVLGVELMHKRRHLQVSTFSWWAWSPAGESKASSSLQHPPQSYWVSCLSRL